MTTFGDLYIGADFRLLSSDTVYRKVSPFEAHDGQRLVDIPIETVVIYADLP